jgi:predicted Zn-dependent peptidase
MSTPTPRTDAAWAQTFEDEENYGNAATDMRDECAQLERELTAEREKVRVLREALESLAYWSRNRLETRFTLRNRIAAALTATEGAK